MDELGFRSSDGIDVSYRRWQAEGEPKAAVLVAHGMSEHSGRYQRLANALTAAGYAVYAPDHRGHGRTSASTGVGRIGPAGVDGILDDLEQLREVAAGEVGGRPVLLFGHSMGALLSQAYAERDGAKLAGLALSGSPGVADELAVLAEAMRQAADGGMGDEPAAGSLSMLNERFEPARTPYDWLSRDPAEVDAYIADPYCGDQHPMTYGFLAAFMTSIVDTMQPDAIRRIPPALPIVLLTGEEDAASNHGAGVRELEKRMRDAGLSVEALWYAGARHEILNETNRDEVTADLLAWFDRVVSA